MATHTVTTTTAQEDVHRFISPTGADYTLNAGETADLIYDSSTDRWRIVAGTGA